MMIGKDVKKKKTLMMMQFPRKKINLSKIILKME